MKSSTPFRSVIFTPGDSVRKLEKAYGFGADVVAFDLEDGVGVNEKEEARDHIRTVLEDHRESDQPVFVRVNGWASERTAEDVRRTYVPWIRGYMLPKVESSEDCTRFRTLFEEVAADDHDLDLIPLVESARGLRQAYDIASTSCVHRLAFGSMDYLDDIGAQWTPEGTEIHYTRSKLVVDSRAAGIEAPLDTIWPRLGDREGLRSEANRARSMGFQGKFVLHPDQIEPIHRAFTPDEEDIAWARKVVRAFEELEEEGRGVVNIEGEFVERPIYRRARALLARAEAVQDGST